MFLMHSFFFLYLDEASCGKWFDVLTVLGSTVKFIPNSELPVIFGK